jgi:riboflavin synthase
VFTGIIEEVGVVAGTEMTGRGLRIEVAAGRVLEDLAIGDSIAVDGVCQTIVARTSTSFSVEAMGPTLARTTFGQLAAKRRVNLERALELGARIGGHMVQGHVDTTGRVERIQPVAEHVLIDVEISDDIADVTVLHGSIALNGVSLTVNEMPADNVVQVALIPHTWENTNLSDLKVGDAVNVEGDMIGRFVVEYMKRRGAHAI